MGGEGGGCVPVGATVCVKPSVNFFDAPTEMECLALMKV